MSAIVQTEAQLAASDREFLCQLKIATRAQLKRMLEVATRLAPHGGKLAWRRAAVERRLGVNRVEFPWFEVE